MSATVRRTRGAFHRFPVPKFAAACVGVIGVGTLQQQEAGAFANVYLVLWIAALVALCAWSVARALRSPERVAARTVQSVLFFSGLALLLAWAQTAFAIASVVIAIGAVTYAILAVRVWNAERPSNA